MLKFSKAKNGGVIVALSACECESEFQGLKDEFFFLSSRYDPEKEAQRYLEAVEKAGTSEKPTMVFLLGAGHLALLEAVLRKHSEENVVVVTKLRTLTALAARESKTLRSRLACSRVSKRAYCLSQAEVDRQLGGLMEKLPTKQLRFYYNQKEVRLFPQFFKVVREKIRGQQNLKSINRATIARFEKLWLCNLTSNTARIIHSYPLFALKNWGRGKSALIASAGPSLAQHLPLLKKSAARVFIIAVDTAYKILLEQGIVADFVVSVDPQKINARYLENIPTKTADRTFLIAEPSLSHSALRSFKKVIMFDTLFPYYRYLASHFKRGAFKGTIDLGGSVASAAYEAARLLRFESVAFLGLDLAYKANAYHVAGALYEEEWFKSNERFSSLEQKMTRLMQSDEVMLTKNQAQQPVFTDAKFILFKEWFEKKLAQLEKPPQFYNASKLGIAITGMPYLSLESWLARESVALSDSKEKLLKTLHESLNRQAVREHHTIQRGTEKLREGLRALKKPLKSYCETAAAASALCSELIALLHQSPFSELSRRSKSLALAEKERQLTEATQLKTFISIAMQKTIQETLNSTPVADQSRAADRSRAEWSELNTQLLKQKKKFFDEVSAVAELYQKRFDKALFTLATHKVCRPSSPA